MKNRPISSPTTNHSPSYTHQILPAHNVSLFPASVDTYNNLGWLIFPASCVLDSIDGSTYNSCMTEVIAVIDTNVLVHAIIGGFEPDNSILTLIDNEHILPCVSNAVIAEYQNIFSNETLNHNDKAGRVLSVTEEHRNKLNTILHYKAKVVSYRTGTGRLANIDWPTDMRDMKFIHVADQAMGSTHSECYLVSRDSHLLNLERELKPFNILVAHPYAFLNKIAQLT